MSSLTDFIKLLKTPFSVDNYYRSLNLALKRLNNEYTMLHYPFYVNPDDDFFQSQKNLTDYCISLLGPVSGKSLFEIGCGNGIQLIYIVNKYKPLYAKGIDLNTINISIANKEKEEGKTDNIYFEINNSQDLKGILDDSFDLIICIESAFHYPDKQSFLNEIRRVLKPDGKFLIADLLFSGKKFTLISKFFRKKFGLYHWTHERYMKGFHISGLKILNISNITDKVLRGFQNYHRWLSEMKNKKPVNTGYIIFYKAILYIFIYLLRHRRIYEVFVGQRI